MIITTITEAIGSTPFFKFTAKDYPMPQHSAIYAKLEYLNPGGSIKDSVVTYAAVTSVFRDTTVGRVDVAGGKQVCYSEQGSFVASCQRPVVRVAITQVGRNIKIVELLVDVQHKVGILLTVFVIAVIIQTFLSFGKFLIGNVIKRPSLLKSAYRVT